MKFSANHPIQISGHATPLAAEVCRSCASGMSGGINVASANFQNIASARNSDEQRSV